VYNEASKAVLRPNSTNFLVGCKFTACSLRPGHRERGFFLSAQLMNRFVSVVTREAQEDTRILVLQFRRQGADAFDSMFEKLGHAINMHFISA